MSPKSSVQVVGNDQYTKQLMAKIATGNASQEEYAAFQAYIDRMKESHPRSAGVDDHFSASSDKAENDASTRPTGPKIVGGRPSRTAESFKTLERSRKSTITTNEKIAEKYLKPYCDFMTDNPTIFHAVDAVKKQLAHNGYKEISERDAWKLERGGKYFLIRNGSALIAFVVGKKYEAGNGAAIVAGHIDALTAKLKPISRVPNKAGYIQLGVAPYAGAPNNTWWDRDLGIGGRVLVREGDKIVTKLVKLDWPIARIVRACGNDGT